MGVSVKITDNMDEVMAQFHTQKEVCLEKLGLAGERFAKGYAPVDTGRLRNSISHASDGNAAYIGTNVEYAPYQELGTSRMKAANGGRGFLNPAVVDHTEDYKAIINSTFKG